MKRTRRIEVIRYTRRVTMNGPTAAPDRGEAPAIDILLDGLGAGAPAPEEPQPEIDRGNAKPPGAPLLRRLLRLPRVRDYFRPRSGTRRHKENEP